MKNQPKGEFRLPFAKWKLGILCWYFVMFYGWMIVSIARTILAAGDLGAALISALGIVFLSGWLVHLVWLMLPSTSAAVVDATGIRFLNFGWPTRWVRWSEIEQISYSESRIPKPGRQTGGRVIFFKPFDAAAAQASLPKLYRGNPYTVRREYAIALSARLLPDDLTDFIYALDEYSGGKVNLDSYREELKAREEEYYAGNRLGIGFGLAVCFLAPLFGQFGMTGFLICLLAGLPMVYWFSHGLIRENRPGVFLPEENDSATEVEKYNR